MLDTILFDLDGTLAPFMQDDFVRLYFKALVRRLAPMGYDGEKLLAALWRGVDAMVANDGTHTNRQVFWESFVADLGVAALALEGDLNDFYGGPDFDAARACLHEEVDRRPLISALREKGYSLVLATNGNQHYSSIWKGKGQRLSSLYSPITGRICILLWKESLSRNLSFRSHFCQ